MIKTIYRRTVPISIRRTAWLKRVKEFLLKALLSHDGIYSVGYYDDVVEQPAQNSAPAISSWIVKSFEPTSVIDVGCGTGALLEVFRAAGIVVFGLEYAEAGVALCSRKGIPCRKFDITADVYSGPRYDVAVSMEVAEHLAKRFADRYVGLLTQLADVVVITAAPPGQGGTDHVNEQPPCYWIEKFRGRSFDFLQGQTEAAKASWSVNPQVAAWYWKNVLIFARSQEGSLRFEGSQVAQR